MRTKDARGKSLIVIKHVRLGNHQASVCLEEPFWIALRKLPRLKALRWRR